MLPQPVGVMACNDDLGVQIMEACKLAGIAVRMPSASLARTTTR
jgi:DNA-binding LacI/PurR family transcriptional regulator